MPPVPFAARSGCQCSEQGNLSTPRQQSVMLAVQFLLDSCCCQALQMPKTAAPSGREHQYRVPGQQPPCIVLVTVLLKGLDVVSIAARDGPVNSLELLTGEYPSVVRTQLSPLS